MRLSMGLIALTAVQNSSRFAILDKLSPLFSVQRSAG